MIITNNSNQKTVRKLNDIAFNVCKKGYLINPNYINSFLQRNEDTEHINYKIHHLLHRPFTYINAYSNISKNKGALSKGVKQDDEIMRFFGIREAETIAELIKSGKYKWLPTRRTMIPKPGKKKLRPIDTPTQRDRIVQEALRGILEGIYEPEFREFEIKNNFQCSNYGFRPQKSCWEAVNTLKCKGQSTNYAIEGDITGAYNNVNHDILISILGKRIKDKKFLKIIRDLLKSGIMEKDTYVHNLKGTPQGGILSPLLFNIYMFEFDKFIYEEIIKPINELNKKLNKKKNSKYQSLLRETKILKSKLRDAIRLDKQEEIVKIKKQLKLKGKTLFKTNSYNIKTLSSNYVYTRYADDWTILIRATKENTEKLKIKISEFIQSKLDMELDLEKTKISKLTEGIQFLGFSIKMNSIKQIKITKTTTTIKGKKVRILRRTTSRKINIIPDKTRILNKLKTNQLCNNNYYPIGKRSWTIYEPYEIVLKYRQIMIGLYNYYNNCDSYYILNRVNYILKYSCAKTLATRLKISTPQAFKKYGKDLIIRKTFYFNSKEINKIVSFPQSQTKNTNNKSSIPFNSIRYDNFDPFKLKEFWRTKLKLYLNCCICDSPDRVGMHHINSLRSIKPGKRDKFDYIRRQTQRIQIPVCHNCHVDITHGKYNKNKPIEFYNLYVAKL